MILRPYQRRAVGRAVAALRKRRNTMIQAATGAGKTIMLSALAGEVGGKTLILQHRQELVQQNMQKFLRVNPGWTASRFMADHKDFTGQAVFAMQQTLYRNRKDLPKFDHIIVDEVHHIVAPTYMQVIDDCMDRNPDLYLSGFTATPVRGDKKSLRKYFDNVAERLTIREMVQMGFLVEPRAFAVDVGTKFELEALRNQSSFGEQTEAARIFDTPVINQEVVKHWKEKAGDRKTIVFCSTCEHARDVAQAFIDADVVTEVVSGDMSGADRAATLVRFDKGNTQVLVNVAVLTEGFDSQPVSCVILLRHCSEQGTMIQMIGRGLRTVDPEIYPGVIKKDCVVLDFGISLLAHGDLAQDDGLHTDMETERGEAPTKECPEGATDRYGNEGCSAEIPAATKYCPLCGFMFEKEGEDGHFIEEVQLTEIDILNASPFRWVDLWGTDTCLMASGFNAWGGVFSPDRGDTWHALGKLKEERRIHRLAIGQRRQAMAAADDFLRQNETEGASKKTRRWLNDPATDKQMEILRKYGYPDTLDVMGSWTKYSAACHANFCFSRMHIERALGVA